jgi:hypothetical protein
MLSNTAPPFINYLFTPDGVSQRSTYQSSWSRKDEQILVLSYPFADAALALRPALDESISNLVQVQGSVGKDIN